MNSTIDNVWPHLSELPAFRALIRSIEHRLLAGKKPFLPPVLDLGIGDGHFGSVALGPVVDFGVDITLDIVREAERRKVYRHLACASATALPFPPDFFATVVSNCVIEHIPDLRSTLAEVHRVLRPDGVLLMTVPTDRLEANLLIQRLFTNVGLDGLATRYVRWFRRAQNHRHLLSREQWKEELSATGFSVLETRGYMSAAATCFFELGHYAGWHNLIARRLTGHWVFWPWRPRFFLTERLIARFVVESEHKDDSCLFVLASKS